MITIANPEKYRAGLYERLSNENIEVASGEIVVSKEDELESGSISTQKIFNVTLMLVILICIYALHIVII